MKKNPIKKIEGRENKDGTFEYFLNSFISDFFHQRMNRLKEKNREGEDKTYPNIFDFTVSGKVKHKKVSPAKQIMN